MKRVLIFSLCLMGCAYGGNGKGFSDSGEAPVILSVPGTMLPDGAACLPVGDLCTDTAYCCVGSKCVEDGDSGSGTCEL